MTPDRCHAGPGHSAPSDHGHWGWLCDECWAWVVAFLDRLLKRDSDTTTPARS